MSMYQIIAECDCPMPEHCHARQDCLAHTLRKRNRRALMWTLVWSAVAVALLVYAVWWM